MSGMTFVAIGGCPATGKTTLMKAIIEQLSQPKPFTFGKLKGQMHEKEKLFILGLYGVGGTFEGTDRLSMAVQPDAVKFLPFAHKKGFRVLFEGDRLFNLKFLKAAAEVYPTRVLILKADEDTLHGRHEQRGDTQSEKFLKGRKTKYANIAKEIEVEEVPHMEPAATGLIAREVLAHLGAL